MPATFNGDITGNIQKVYRVVSGQVQQYGGRASGTKGTARRTNGTDACRDEGAGARWDERN